MLDDTTMSETDTCMQFAQKGNVVSQCQWFKAFLEMGNKVCCDCVDIYSVFNQLEKRLEMYSRPARSLHICIYSPLGILISLLSYFIVCLLIHLQNLYFYISVVMMLQASDLQLNQNAVFKWGSLDNYDNICYTLFIKSLMLNLYSCYPEEHDNVLPSFFWMSVGLSKKNNWKKKSLRKIYGEIT